ncbi:MAG: hypothetical protein JSW50_05475 [Candidatus Latescibacterota bacterium]|nr:MAG: hypothetical protein JSW50_05475 [Candidatus Latescibacterota bacterium]
MKRKIEYAALMGILLFVFWAGGAQAGPVWICSITNAVECLDDGTVGEPDFGGLEPATFFRVDPDKKKITLLAPESRSGEITVIDKVVEKDDMWVLTGIEAGRAWSMVISGEGYVTLSIAYDGVTWSAFGHSMLEE